MLIYQLLMHLYLYDYGDIIDSEFTVTKVHWSLTTAPAGTLIGDQREKEFTDNCKDKDVIAYRNHGAPDAWDFLTTGDLVTITGTPIVDLGNTNPFILSLCCLTGCYEDHVNPTCKDYDGHDDNFAEAFFNLGAAVFIGATEISFGEYNSPAGKWFFNNWDADEDIGTVFTQLERDKWTGKVGKYCY